MTKNLTMAFDDELLDALRVYAAERKTTVNALFRKHAESLLAESERSRAARAWMVAKARENMRRDEEREAARARGEDVGPDSTWRWSREETYAERQWPRDK
ncbi:MAG: hypothetical protein C0472_09315 [Erythrobacter sp.]|nr:hypothetical protein [Erythrobacter sp.]MBA4767368.1 hypothetical protein [Porphyrobacter sp.]